jgi:hypothetical protein
VERVLEKIAELAVRSLGVDVVTGCSRLSCAHPRQGDRFLTYERSTGKSATSGRRYVGSAM